VVQHRPLPRAQPRCSSEGRAVRGGLPDQIRVDVALCAPRIFIRWSTWPAPSSYAPTASWHSFRRAPSVWRDNSIGSPRPRPRRAALHSRLRLPCRRSDNFVASRLRSSRNVITKACASTTMSPTSEATSANDSSTWSRSTSTWRRTVRWTLHRTPSQTTTCRHMTSLRPLHAWSLFMHSWASVRRTR
jgi:hypothetical protein